MHFKALFNNLLIFVFLSAIAYGLYHYLQSPPEHKKHTARYQENDQEILFHENADEGAKLDDCERYLDRSIAENCVEARQKNNPEQLP